MERTTITDVPATRNGSRPGLRRVPIAMPPGDRVEQDVEWCVARVDGQWQEVRFHDYGLIYEVPGLYERIFYDVLRCASPETVCGLLADELDAEDLDGSVLRVLDLGAGNGIMAEELAAIGAEHVVGVDILDEAAAAAERDRPGVYADYLVADLCDIDPRDQHALEEAQLNCLTCVAALGFGDIPPKAFRTAFDLIADDGWAAFNIKADFLDGGDGTGFSRLIARMIEEDILDARVQTRYRHRDASNGDPIDYVAIIGRKNRSIGDSLPGDD